MKKNRDKKTNKNKTLKSRTIEHIVANLEKDMLANKQKQIAVDLLKEFKSSYNKLLKEAEHENHFITNDNKRLRHLFDLFSALENMEDHVFKQHVNQFKNDFSRWIKDVFDHKELAYRIAKLGSRKEIKECIGQEIGKFFKT